MPNNMKWTPDQQKAIDARGGTLIVSAAAGSGKTAVLVERCIRRLLDTEHPCNADELLIVTFTRAATAEMRNRLSQAISDRLLEDPDNEHLQNQQMLLPSAHICTIDAFCGNLVRENFEHLGIAPDFRMLDETEEKVLQQNAMDRVLEELYTAQDPAFTRLVELLATGRDDTSIEENIRRLHTYSRAYPSPRHWLETGLSLFDDPTGAYRLLKAAALEALDSWTLRWTDTLRILDAEQAQSDLDYSGTEACIKGYIAEVEELQALVEKEDWAAFAETASNLDIPQLKKPSLPKGETTTVLELCKETKKKFTKTELKKEFSRYAITPPEDAAIDSGILKPLAQKLVDAVLRFDEVYAELKREENALDFADTELMALELLVEDPAAETFKRKELAEDLRQQFKEILIDEYQDTNKLQDTIFAALSKDDLFMVGDVKQSIYRFRQAMPELFLAKKERYDLYDAEKNEYPATVVLGKNFRSRQGILRAVNHTFSRLMSRSVGEICYDKTEQLYFGAEDRYPEREEPDVEFHIVVPEQGIDKREAEAAHIARYIAEEIRKSKDTESPLTYKDFAILMRAPGTTAAAYRKVLTEAGIPVYAETGTGFLDTPEVMTVLSLLSVIDNPVQDVPLLSVMLSPLFGFQEDEVAALRVNARKGNLYQAVLKGEEDGKAHCAQFLNELRSYRTLSLSMGAGELLRRIYEETAYDTIVGAMNVGEQRVANLQMLLHYADSYDANSSSGASGFVRYMDRLREQDGSLNVAATLSPNANVVQIMSIHKSKGLEFKVCIVADLKHQFNDGELNKGLILHPELGIGLKGRQPDTGFTYPTLIHSAMKEATLRSERSEALRVLYVAMTRAKEKLVLTACDAPKKNAKNDPLESTLRGIAARLYGGETVPPLEVLRTNTFYHWCLLAFLQHPDAALLRARAADSAVSLLPVLPPEEAFPMTFVIDNFRADTEASTGAQVPYAEEAPAADPARVSVLRERMSYRYPYAELSRTLSKRSASHLGDKPFSTEFFAETRPESLSKNGMTPAERGTCLHKFMQYADFDRAADDPAEETGRLVREGFLLEEEAAVVDPAKVRAFFSSDIAARMKKSPRVLREHKFAILLPAGRFEEGLEAPLSEEKVLIQGIIDCAFEEDGHMVLLDYKTDRVQNGEDLAARYRDQLELYRVALEETLGLPVSEVCLYSFTLGETVPL